MYCDSMCRLVVIDPGNVCCTISSLQICYLLACSILVIGRYLYSMVSVNRNIVIYNKYIVVVTVVVVFVSYCDSDCDFVKTFYSRYWCVQVQVQVPYLFYF